MFEPVKDFESYYETPYLNSCLPSAYWFDYEWHCVFSSSGMGTRGIDRVLQCNKWGQLDWSGTQPRLAR